MCFANLHVTFYHDNVNIHSDHDLHHQGCGSQSEFYDSLMRLNTKGISIICLMIKQLVVTFKHI